MYRLIFILALLGHLAVAGAQAPPVDDPDPADADPSLEAPPEPAPEDAARPADDPSQADSADPEPADPMLTDDTLAGPAAAVEEDSAIQATAEEEFNPDEEISEDYPVPLPSDI
ncbi:MAG: hypothetical protein R3233_00645 [Xanthomonadales bacterium]|nr:hypothetical protein [Xanthomonadales bacterium]